MDGREIGDRLIEWLDYAARTGGEVRTQGALAEKARVSPTTVSGIVTASIAHPRRSTVFKLAKALGTESLEEFLEGPLAVAVAREAERRRPREASIWREHEPWARSLAERTGTEGSFAVRDERARLERDYDAESDALTWLERELLSTLGFGGESLLDSVEERLPAASAPYTDFEDAHRVVRGVVGALEDELRDKYQRKGRALDNLRASMPGREAEQLAEDIALKVLMEANA